MNFDGLIKDNKILKHVAKSNADIICMQENGESGNDNYLKGKDIRKALADYPYYQKSSLGKNNCGNQIAIYSKYPILSTKRIPYESLYNGSVAHEIKIGNDTLLLINNHLESNKLTGEDKATFGSMLKDPDANKVKSGARHLINKLGEASAIRSVQADSIASFIKNTNHKSIVVCGDFNDSPISYTHRMIGNRLNDAFAKSGKGLGISYNQNRFYFRIDHILTSKNIKAYNCTVDRSFKESDHYPIMTYIKIND